MTEPWNPMPLKRAPTVLMFALFTASVALGACATPQPFSQLDGVRWRKGELYTYDTVIVSIDGESYAAGQDSRLKIEPGHHHILLQTSPAPGFRYSPEKALDLDVKPCTRYWFEAKRVNAITQDFEPRVNYQEPIGGCGATSGASG